MMLSKLNAHERDQYGVFEEEPHIYFYKGKQMKKSVTTLVHENFPKFNAQRMAQTIVKKQFDKEGSNYYQMTKEAILQQWEDNKNEACALGTELHKSIELFYNDIEVSNDSVEYSYFQNFLNDHKHLKAYRTEWEVFYEDIGLAGSIDMVFENPDGTFSIYDWKRSKEIKKSNSFEFGLGELDHLPNSNFWTYSLQLNVYKYILETKYNFKIKDLFLVVMHPNKKNYNKLECPNLQNEVEILLSK